MNDLQVSDYNITQPAKAIKLANDVAKLIKEKSLSVTITGKQYVMAEGWQFVGLSFGIIPIVSDIKDMSNSEEIKYGCSVDLINTQTQAKVGFGFALCSNKEKSKTYFDEYAIVSMAQTRAIGKAYRNLLAWIMKSAGFEPTPFEEMEETKYHENHEPTIKEPTNAKEAATIVITFGKNKGKSLADIWKSDKSYIDWLKAESKDAIIKKAILLMEAAVAEKNKPAETVKESTPEAVPEKDDLSVQHLAAIDAGINLIIDKNAPGIDEAHRKGLYSKTLQRLSGHPFLSDLKKLPESELFRINKIVSEETIK